MPSLVDVVNGALRLIGESPISGLDDATTKADICNTEVETSLSALLMDSKWNFCKTRKTFAADGQAPAFGFAFQYTLPGDCLCVWGIGDNGKGESDGSLDYKMEIDDNNVQKLLTNEPAPLAVHYSRNVRDPNLWGGSFMLAVKYFFASAFAASIAHDNQKSATLLQMFDTVFMPNARARDGQQGSIDCYESPDLLLVRDVERR